MENIRKIRIIFTSDIHGNYFPYDFRKSRWGKGSLQRVHAFVAQQVKRYAGSFILIDGGDILQGEPTSYYFNNISKSKRHRVADMCNFIGYDVGVLGNHDIEGGHKLFDRFVRDCNYPILGANVLHSDTHLPYFEPYTIFKRSGIKVAVIGFITPAIPHWMPKTVWSGMEFEDITKSAEKWVKHVRETHNPDFIIALLHSGMDDGIIEENYRENAVRDMVTKVDGFDLVLYGHDHTSNMEEIESPSGKSVLCVNPGSYAQCVAEVQVKFNLDAEGKVTKYDQICNLCYVGTMHNMHAKDFQTYHHKDFAAVKAFAEEEVGTLLNDICIQDAYFGPSAYIDLIHKVQLSTSKADISMAAPLFFSGRINAGVLHNSDLFNLYRFEDRLFTILLKGDEILRYLNCSYDKWVNQMSCADDDMLQLQPMKKNPNRMGFKNFLFNFDSAAGICYEVDLRKGEGEKVNVISMADGTPFDKNKEYKVALTAYRINGGGELLTKGTGLSKDEIDRRTIGVSERDIRFYLLNYLRDQGEYDPVPTKHWRFTPGEWCEAAQKREREILFSSRQTSDKEDEQTERS